MAAVLRSVCAGIALLSMTLSGVDASAASFDWVTVGDPGNACTTLVDAGSQTTYCAGGVAYSYQISKYETTNAQYAEFLNAVAASDPNSLYSGNMNSSAQGGIVRSGLAGSFSYATKPGFEDKPVDYVTFYDALRFANWVQNGQPTGAQGAGTTETGAYAITAQGIANNSITRDGAATIFLTNDDEWVKAAYYDAVSQSFNLFPASTSVPTACFPAGVPTNTQANTANCEGTQLVGGLTVKGLYLNSASPSGTFDQGGNVWEWTEAAPLPGQRAQRGGSYIDAAISLRDDARTVADPTTDRAGTGFRIAQLVPVPEPSTGLLVVGGMLALAIRRRSA